MENDPTRHAKSKPEPQTIDLEASEVKDIPTGEAEGTEEDVRATSVEDDVQATESTVDPAPESNSASTASDTSGTHTYNPTPGSAPQRTQSGVSLFAAALVGGVVVLAGAAGLQYWGVLPSLNADDRLEQSLNLLTGEVNAVKNSVAELQAAKPEVDFAPIDQKIAAIEEKLAQVPEPNGLSADADARLSALQTQVGEVRAGIDELKQTAAEERAALLMRIEALEKKAAEPRDDVEVAIAIASASLKAAIDRGGAFKTELDTLAGINPDNAAVKELQAFAAAGVPSRAQLVADFPAVADRIIAAENQADPNQSLTDRLLSSAFSAVKVRPVGEVEGDAAEAIVARMESRLINGDLTAAKAEWDKLPEAGKNASKSFADSLSARIRVEELVGSTLARAVKSTDTKG